MNAHCIEQFYVFFFFNDTATTDIYTLSLHDALPISLKSRRTQRGFPSLRAKSATSDSNPSSPDSTVRAGESGEDGFESRSEEHTSELQSPCNIVCRLLLEKKRQPIDS